MSLKHSSVGKARHLGRGSYGRPRGRCGHRGQRGHRGHPGRGEAPADRLQLPGSRRPKRPVPAQAAERERGRRVRAAGLGPLAAGSHPSFQIYRRKRGCSQQTLLPRRGSWRSEGHAQNLTPSRRPRQRLHTPGTARTPLARHAACCWWEEPRTVGALAVCRAEGGPSVRCAGIGRAPRGRRPPGEAGAGRGCPRRGDEMEPSAASDFPLALPSAQALWSGRGLASRATWASVVSRQARPSPGQMGVAGVLPGSLSAGPLPPRGTLTCPGSPSPPRRPAAGSSRRTAGGGAVGGRTGPGRPGCLGPWLRL